MAGLQIRVDGTVRIKQCTMRLQLVLAIRTGAQDLGCEIAHLAELACQDTATSRKENVRGRKADAGVETGGNLLRRGIEDREFDRPHPELLEWLASWKPSVRVRPNPARSARDAAVESACLPSNKGEFIDARVKPRRIGAEVAAWQACAHTSN